ncbi:hypothetical protein [Methylomonas rivi]|uniref:Uncharacterized protein n=1 Tax=Methylomonas rivi TaxID=2952226 RepID=A0ABT1U3E6_9GAMM|nr:hypothetical protein [Methylomonas sp. WSC-6]MCQ8128362.1 hypothetical protein [Methylomonas sp. WSC-6]
MDGINTNGAGLMAKAGDYTGFAHGLSLANRNAAPVVFRFFNISATLKISSRWHGGGHPVPWRLKFELSSSAIPAEKTFYVNWLEQFYNQALF